MAKQIIRVGLRPPTTEPQEKIVSFGWSGKSQAQLERSKRIELCGQLWTELHAQENPTRFWFAAWLSRVPNFGCSCRRDFSEYLKTNPPRFDDFYAWSVEAHNWVNAKLGKPIFIP